MNMCLHCLEEGDWTDEDKCPRCEAEFHVSPWRVSKCPACNKEYFDKTAKLKRDIDLRAKDHNEAIADCQLRIRKLEEQVADLISASNTGEPYKGR